MVVGQKTRARRRGVRIPEATEDDKKAQRGRSAKYGIGIKAGGNVTKPGKYGGVADGDFADPVNYRYPLSPAVRAANAVTRFNSSANRAAGGYSTEEWAKMGKRIAAANKGKTYRDGQVVDERSSEARVKMADGTESIDQYSERVRSAFREQFKTNDPMNYSRWVRDVWTDHVVAEYDGNYFAIPFSEAQGQVTFETDQLKWTKVEQRYIPISEALAGFKIVEAAGEVDEDKRGTEWEVTIIGPETAEDVIEEDGQTYIRSKNGRLYAAKALKAGAPLFEGVKVYDNHLTDEEFEQKQGMRSIKEEWVGVIVNPTWDKAANAIKATLKVVDAKLRKKFVEAYDAKVLDKIGLSIDALGEGATRAVKALGGQSYQVVEKITKALSVDVVADPAAGGRLARLIAAQNPYEEALEMKPEELTKIVQDAVAEANKPMDDRMKAIEAELAEEAAPTLKASEAAVALAGKHSIDLAEVKGTGEGGEITEADVQVLVDAKAKLPAPAEPPKEIQDAIARANKAAEAAEAREKDLALRAAKSELAETLAGSGLPKPTQAVVSAQFADRLFKPDELKGSIEAQRKMLSELSASGIVRIPEGHRISVSPLTDWDEFEMALMRLMAGPTEFGRIVSRAKEQQKKSDEERDHYAPQRFSEAIGRYIEAGTPAFPHPVRLSEWFYALMGGVDAAVDGRLRNQRLLEAAITTGSVSSIVKNVVNLMLAADYSIRLRWWEPIVRQEDVETLDDATLVRVHGVGGLNVMAEGDTYLELAWTDEEETASFVKRGGYLGVTLETFLRDKLNVLRSLPNRLANAWYNEISGLVSRVFTVNTAAGPVLSDGGALFNSTALTSAGGHANLRTTALSYAEAIAVRTAMRKQTDQALGAGKRLAIAPKFLVVPVDLENVAEQIRMSELVPSVSGGATGASETQTANILKGSFETIVNPEFTDTDNWAAVADPAQFPAIYLIWLRGRRTPELFSADDERGGAMFTNDELRYKARMFGARFSATYDTAPVGDFRPLHKSNV